VKVVKGNVKALMAVKGEKSGSCNTVM